MVLLQSCLRKSLIKVYEAISEENAELTTIAEENLAGVRTVKAFAREKFEISKFLSHNKRYYDLNMSEAKTMVKYDPVFNFMGVLLPIMCTVLGGISVMKGTDGYRITCGICRVQQKLHMAG